MADESPVADAEFALVHQPPTGLFRTDDPVEVVTKATRVADALAQVIRQKRLFARIQGKDHVMVEGWQLLGGMLGVSAVCVATEPIEGGYKATVEARNVEGRVIGRAEALCTRQETRGPWKTADDHALLSMAQTRATSKALKGPLGFIVSLAGYATTPAEEMPREETTAKSAPTPTLEEIDGIRKRWKTMFESDPPLDVFNRFCKDNWDDVPMGMRGPLDKAIQDHADKAQWWWDGQANQYVKTGPTRSAPASNASEVPF